ncbi:hypothetical protein GQ457_04G015550 [Hibiscus cannabinus]
MPDFEAEHFELKPVMFNMLNTIGQFGGTPNENARQHLKSFLEICNSFKIHGVSNDVLKLKLFPYSLRDKAKTWLNNLQPGSLQSWTQLCRSFLAKFSYTNMTDHLRNQITSFRQEDDEAMHEAWERYIDLFKRCPMHGLPEWTQVSIFYNSVNTPMRMMLDASAQNDYQHPTFRRGNTRRGPTQLDSSDTILAQIASLTNMRKKKPYSLILNMFKNTFQSGFLSILYSLGSKPLQIWDKEVENGHVKRPHDDDIQSDVLEIIGSNIQSTFITCPADPSATLGIKLPFLVMIVKNLKKYFSFEIQVLDDKNVRRRFRASNFQAVTRVKPYICTMPLRLDEGWNQIQLNLADYTRRAYGTNYVETLRVQVHANCRLRRIYFSDRLYSEEELPPEFKLYLPMQKA